MTRIAVNGLYLNVEVTGEGPAMLLLHGFTGSAATWSPFLDEWRDFTCLAVDLHGHGLSDSPADPERYRMERTVEDLLALLDRLGMKRAGLLGYSMGGRVAFHLALRAQERFSALVLESASPGIDDPSEREARVHSDNALADDIMRDGIVAFVDGWEALPLFASQARLSLNVRQSLRRQRLGNSPLGLANSLRGLGAGRQEPVLACLGELRLPVLLIAGALDARYTFLARQMAERIPTAKLEIVPDAGHAVHLEQPSLYGRLVHEFLSACWSGTASNRII